MPKISLLLYEIFGVPVYFGGYCSMKKAAILLSLILLLIQFSTGCTNQATPVQNEEIHIVTSFYPMYILTKNITKDAKNVIVSNMTEQQTGCLHDYSLLPQDMKILSRADVFVMNGGGLESFMDKVTSQMPNLTIINASENIPLLNNNPHIWVSIKGAIEQTANITKKLCEYDPKNAELYKKNSADFSKRLEDQYDKMKTALKPFEGQYITTFHEAFDYFASDFGLKISAVVEVEPGNEPTPSQLTQTIDAIKSTHTKALFDEPNAASSASQTIANATGLKIHTLNPVTSGDDDIDAYFKIMNENLKALQEGLQ